MTDRQESQSKEMKIELPIEYYVPETIVSHYATTLAVQHAEHEFIVSFFEIMPPLILGPDKDEQVRNLDSVRAVCVARIIIAKDRMPGFIKALETHQQLVLSHQDDTE